MSLYSTFIVRQSSEIGLKGTQARRRFVSGLENQFKFALKKRNIKYTITQRASCFVLKTNEPEETDFLIRHMFGVGTHSRVLAESKVDVTDIIAVGAETFANLVKGKTFCVRAKKSGPQKFGTMDIERQLGAELAKHGKVKLKDPEITAYVEVQNQESCYFFTERVRGAGGYPLGVSGRALALMSGGFDSVVAAWSILKRGVEVDFLFCNLGGKAYERLVLQVVKVLCELWCHGMKPKFFVVDFHDVLNEIQNSIDKACQQVVLKRLMFRAAERIAQERGVHALATGESIGQVSSQTIANLSAISAAVPESLVLRPISSFDKREIIDLARMIGTAPLSERIKEYCSIASGSLLLSGDLNKINAAESHFNFDIFDKAVEDTKRIHIADVDADSLRTPYLFKDKVPESSVLIDCQQRNYFDLWHAPEAIHLEINQLLRSFKKFDKDKTYLIYCTYGTQSPLAAEVMQQSGYEAYAFEGGLSRFKKKYQTRALT